MKGFEKHLRFIFLFVLSIYSATLFAQQPTVDKGEIHGTVYGHGNQQPLGNANVRLIETNQHQLSNEEGEFRFTNLRAGEYTLTVSAKGHRVPEDETVVTIRPGQMVEVQIYLEPVEFLFEEIRVTSPRPAVTVSRQTLSTLEIKRIPGTGGDAIRALQALPGIGVANDFSGELHIRGGSPLDNRFYLDRTPLGYPYHFGGLVSTLSTEVIDRIDVYAGGFGAEFGADAQAVIDIHSRRGREDRLGGRFNLNLLYSEGFLEGPLGKRGTWYLAGRRSYADLLPIEVEEITAFPRFWDYQAKVSFDLNEVHQFSFNAFAMDDFFELNLDLEDVDNDPALVGKLHSRESFNAQGVHLRSLLTDRLTSNLSISWSNYSFDLSAGEGFFLRLQPTQYEFREDLTYRLNKKHQLESGVLASTAEWDVSSFFTRPPDEGDPGYDFTSEEKVESDFRKRFSQIEGYLQNRYSPFAFLEIALGFRLGYFNLTDRLSAGPRASMRVKVSNNSEVRFAYGRYEQRPQPWHIAPEFGNPDVKASTAIHYILEAQRQILPQTHLKVAAYQKDLSELITRDAEAAYLNQGKGFARGVEVSLNHRVGEKFFGWANYAYSVSRRQDRPGDPERLYSFDQTHVATLTASYKLTPTWEIGAKWQYRTGNPYTPVTGTRLEPHPTTSQLRHVPVYGETNSRRVAPFQRLDLRISKSFIYERWRWGIFLEIFNVFNHKNVLEFDYNEDYTDQEIIHQLPLIPYVGVTVEF